MTSEVTGADVNFEHRSYLYHCATLTALFVVTPWWPSQESDWTEIWSVSALTLWYIYDLCQKNRDYVSKMENLFYCI
jgi:hypothetical protein